MSELISGKDALIALANGEEVECRAYEKNWVNANNPNHNLGLFSDENFQFRLKPRTITINGIEVPAPFEPACSEDYFFIVNSTFGYASSVNVGSPVAFYGKWRTESEIKQVVEALRSVFKPQ